MAGKSKLAIREPVADPGERWWGFRGCGCSCSIVGPRIQDGGVPFGLDLGGGRAL